MPALESISSYFKKLIENKGVNPAILNKVGDTVDKPLADPSRPLLNGTLSLTFRNAAALFAVFHSIPCHAHPNPQS